METDKIKNVIIEEELKQSYLDYSMSVIVGRALPDVRDGLKPVHRRILYSFWENNWKASSKFVKSAKVVGAVIGNYHPHGDVAVYDAMVRLAQDFSMRYPLVKGQGNFGSVDGDPPASYRYTEAKLSKISEEMLQDIDKETVLMAPNFDNTLKEPVVLPSRLPNLLVNGSSGIAVGMATNIPPHNILEVCSAVTAILDNPEISINELMNHIQGPDFPTGGIICGNNGIREAYGTGRGKITVRAKTECTEKRITITEIPYQVNKSQLIENIAELVKDKKIEGISNIRDESDKEGLTIVIEIKHGFNPEIILNNLYKHTALETTFGCIFIALVDNQPKLLPLKDILSEFVLHRKDVILKRTAFDLRKAEERAHVLEGLKIALLNIDEIIPLIKKSKDGETAKNGLINNYKLTEIQAQAILDMKLQRLTGLEQEKIIEELKTLGEQIIDFKDIIKSEIRVLDIIKNDMNYLKETYGDKRKTAIACSGEDICNEDLIKKERVVVTMSHAGYVKRVSLESYRAQRRGGKGVVAAGTKEEDYVERLFVCDSHATIMFFSNLGKVYWLKAYGVSEGNRYAKGTAIVNLLKLAEGEKIQAMIAVDEFLADNYLIMATKKGIVKKTSLLEYSRPRQGGVIGINLRDDDSLVNVVMTNGEQQLFLATKDGRAVRFKESDVREVARNSIGVRGINVRDSEVVGMEICYAPFVLTVTDKGYGKRSRVNDYRLINRGGSGVVNIKSTEKNGIVVGIKVVAESDDVMFITKDGVLIRTPSTGISVVGRNSQGVRLMKLAESDLIVSITSIVKEEEDVEAVREEFKPSEEVVNEEEAEENSE